MAMGFLFLLTFLSTRPALPAHETFSYIPLQSLPDNNSESDYEQDRPIRKVYRKRKPSPSASNDDDDDDDNNKDGIKRQKTV